MSEAIAYRLKQIMTAEHLSLTQTAKLIGISPSSMRKVLKDAEMSRPITFKINRFIDAHPVQSTAAHQFTIFQTNADGTTTKETETVPAATPTRRPKQAAENQAKTETTKPDATQEKTEPKQAAKTPVQKPATRNAQTRTQQASPRTTQSQAQQTKPAAKQPTKPAQRAQKSTQPAPKTPAAAKPEPQKAQTTGRRTVAKPIAAKSQNQTQNQPQTRTQQQAQKPAQTQNQTQTQKQSQAQNQSPAQNQNQQKTTTQVNRPAQSTAAAQNRPTTTSPKPATSAANQSVQPTKQTTDKQAQPTQNAAPAPKTRRSRRSPQETETKPTPTSQTRRNTTSHPAPKHAPNPATQPADGERAVPGFVDTGATTRNNGRSSQPRSTAPQNTQRAQNQQSQKSAASQQSTAANATTQSAPQSQTPRTAATAAAQPVAPKAAVHSTPVSAAASTSSTVSEAAPTASVAPRSTTTPAINQAKTPVVQPALTKLHAPNELQIYMDESFANGNDYQRSMYVGATVTDPSNQTALQHFSDTLYPFGWQPGDEVKARGKNRDQIQTMLLHAKHESAQTFSIYSPLSDAGNFAMSFGIIFPYLAALLRILGQYENTPAKVHVTLDQRSEIHDDQLGLAARMMHAYLKAQTGKDVIFMMRTTDSRNELGVQYSDFISHAAMTFGTAGQDVSVCGIKRLDPVGSRPGDQLVLYAMVGLQKYLLDDRPQGTQPASYQSPILNIAAQLFRLATKATTMANVPDETFTQAKLVVTQLLQVVPSAINGAINKMPFQNWFDICSRATGILHYTDETLPKLNPDPDTLQIANDALNNIATLLAR
ncbi:hypothetical protein [Lacticaseibacillus yichunensis]|uniref:DUF3800 domain-containing protein n=1 Tax=Lacticaseibacillus yichunensis TaxID=2486015 RepID=A0ABW4CSJ5_9LACO|nr:hypothetical protein [Lacticaseibacillus yichunensis]